MPPQKKRKKKKDGHRFTIWPSSHILKYLGEYIFIDTLLYHQSFPNSHITAEFSSEVTLSGSSSLVPRLGLVPKQALAYLLILLLLVNITFVVK